MAHIQNVWIDSILTNPGNRHLCCGCSACESVCGKKAISMKADKEAFMYPKVNDKICVDCGMCVKVCPVINECENKEPYLKSYGGYSKDEHIINSCASGGVATALSFEIIKQGGVVYGVRFNETYSASDYVRIDKKEDLWALCSSKYVQPAKSGIHATVKSDLNNGLKVLFIGCPCDIAGLKRYLRKDYDNLLTCELFCAGITSNKILDEYRALREKKVGAKLIAFNVRNKEKGWFVQHIKEEYQNGKVYYKNHFGTYLGYGFLNFRRPSCYHCQYKQNATMCDIKVGDFWGIKSSDPYWNSRGVSVIMAKTQKGDDALKALPNFLLYEIDHTKATINNAGFMGHPNENLLKRRERFAHVFINQEMGLEAACKATAPKSFWVKYYVPTSFRTFMKKLLHELIDKK